MQPNVVNNFVKVSQERNHIIVKNAGGLQGIPGPAGAGLQIDGSVNTYADLPQHLKPEDAGVAYFVQADGLLYVWSGTKWPEEGEGAQFQGPRGIQGPPGIPGADGQDGEPGPANTLTIGTVQTSSTAAATITGESPNQTLNLYLPKGDPGEDSYIPDLATFKSVALDTVYPVGSIYISDTNTSPASFLGGTWSAVVYPAVSTTMDIGTLGADTTREVTVSVTTHGNPVFISFTADNNPVDNVSTWTTLRVYRGETLLQTNTGQTDGQASHNTTATISMLDFPAVGTYTYKFSLYNGGGNTSYDEEGATDKPRYTIYELGYQPGKYIWKRTA